MAHHPKYGYGGRDSASFGISNFLSNRIDEAYGWSSGKKLQSIVENIMKEFVSTLNISDRKPGYLDEYIVQDNWNAFKKFANEHFKKMNEPASLTSDI